jgi:hypothetical protein
MQQAVIHLRTSSCKIPIIFRQILNQTRIFQTDFSKNPQIWIFMNTRPVGAELFHADGQTDGHENPNNLSSQFRESA